MPSGGAGRRSTSDRGAASRPRPSTRPASSSGPRETSRAGCLTARRCASRRRRGVPPDGQRVRGVGGDRAMAAVRPRHAVPRPARQRPGALHRPGRRLFIVASEPYGVVEETSEYVRLDGETGRKPRRDRRVAARRGHARRSAAPRLRRHRPASLSRRRRHRRGHHPRHRPGRRTALPVEGDLRGAASASPRPCAARSSNTTARSRSVGDRALPADVAGRLADGSIAPVPGDRPGHGGRRRAEHGRHPRRAERRQPRRRRRSPPPSCRASACASTCATRWPSPSARAGTTTDTNRTVDLLARPRGGGDRPSSTAAQRPHRQGRRRAVHVRRARRGDERRLDEGVLRPGRRRARCWPARSPRRPGSAPPPAHELLAALRDAARRDAHGARPPRRRSPRPPGASPQPSATGRSSATAPTRSPPRRCGSSVSELCYKSIACDVTEDKKHIDLSSEPLILVCAAGLSGSTADDVGQGGGDLPGPQGHPDRGRRRRRRALRRRAATIARAAGRIPALGVRAVGDGRPPVRLRGGAGDRRLGRPLREAREAIEHAVGRGGRRRRRARPRCERGIGRRAERFVDGAAHRRVRRPPRGEHRRAPGAGCCATCRPTSRSRRTSASTGKVGTPAALIDDLVAALTRAIEELTRPVDAIKHQAKTVTVGISRSDEGVIDRAARAGRARRRRRARRAHLPHAQGARRPRPGRRRGHRATPATASTGASGELRSPSSTAAASPASCPAGVERQPRTARHQAPRRRRARGARGPRPQRRAHGDLRARGQGHDVRRASRCCTCASTTGCRRRRCAACCRATTAGTTASSTG